MPSLKSPHSGNHESTNGHVTIQICQPKREGAVTPMPLHGLVGEGATNHRHPPQTHIPGGQRSRQVVKVWSCPSDPNLTWPWTTTRTFKTYVCTVTTTTLCEYFVGKQHETSHFSEGTTWSRKEIMGECFKVHRIPSLNSYRFTHNWRTEY